MRYLYLHLFSIHLMYNNAATSILLFSCKHSLIAFMWNILAQKVFQVIDLSSPFVSVFTILNVRKLLTPNSLDAVTVKTHSFNIKLRKNLYRTEHSIRSCQVSLRRRGICRHKSLIYTVVTRLDIDNGLPSSKP